MPNVKTTKLGPGTLIFTGPDAGTLDASCQVEKMTVSWSKSKKDDVLMLCGDTKPGRTTYTAQLAGTVDQDLSDVAGLVFWTWTNRGKQVEFEYVPNTAAGAQVTGTLTVDPLDVGGDTGGADMTSDFTWDCVGEPDLTHVTLPTSADDADDADQDDTAGYVDPMVADDLAGALA